VRRNEEEICSLWLGLAEESKIHNDEKQRLQGVKLPNTEIMIEISLHVALSSLEIIFM